MIQTYDRHRAMRDRADGLFDRSWFIGQVKALLARVTGANRNLRFLSDIDSEGVHTETLKRTPIPIDRIKGTEGRTDRFDKDFHPRLRRNKARWMGVAVAIMDNYAQLPPIEVVQVGDVYYVLDGHHRVSAAKALGKITIDANIIRWQF